MDTLTHIALGACIGEIMLGKKIGKRALLLGAIGQSVPDIDFIAGFWLSPAGNLLAHRGFTHSILFACLITILLALLGERWHRPHNISIRKWLFFFGLQIFIHLFLDAFNAYGIGWFEPFSHYRVSFNTLFVADPFFSAWIGIGFLALILLRKQSKKRQWWAKFGIVLSSMYFIYSLANKLMIDSRVNHELALKHIQYHRYFTTPSPFNNWLWYTVAESDSGYFVGYCSLFDDGPEIPLTYFPRLDSLLYPVHDHEDLQQLKRFSKGFYTAENWHDTLVFNDLRFGQSGGWQYPYAHFSFHYYLQQPNNNRLVVQRGRFENWNWTTMRSLIRRIQGKEIFHSAIHSEPD